MTHEILSGNGKTDFSEAPLLAVMLDERVDPGGKLDVGAGGFTQLEIKTGRASFGQNSAHKTSDTLSYFPAVDGARQLGGFFYLLHRIGIERLSIVGDESGRDMEQLGESQP